MSDHTVDANKKVVAFLRRFNAWRRGSESIEQPHPTEIGDAIDAACTTIDRQGHKIKALERLLAKERGHTMTDTATLAVLRAMREDTK